MPKKKKPVNEMTTEELARWLFKPSVLKQLKAIANPKPKRKAKSKS